MSQPSGWLFSFQNEGGFLVSDDKKNSGLEVETPSEAPALGQSARGKAEPMVTDPAPAVKTESAVPESPGASATEQHNPEKKTRQTATPDKGNPAQAPAGKVVDFAAVREVAAKDKAPKEKAPKQKAPAEKDEVAAKATKGRPPKADKTASDKGKQPKPRDKMSQSKADHNQPTPALEEVPAVTKASAGPAQPRDASRGEKEEIVYLNLAELHPFKNHPFGVRDDAEMQGLVESVRASGVNQPALVRPRADGGYEIIAGHRRQRASELAGFVNMPCIVRNMTDDEAILAMTDDNLRHREKILPTEKAAALKQQVEAIKHQGARSGEEDIDAGKRSTQVVGDRNGMNYKQVQRYIRLTELVPDLQKMVDEKRLAFTPAVEISFIRPKHQKYIAVSIEGQQSSPSLSQAQKMRELDKSGKLNGDVIDGILSQEKKEVDKVIINSAELEKYFGKDKSPREMKDKIISLLDDWKAKQPPELGKPEKKTDREK